MENLIDYNRLKDEFSPEGSQLRMYQLRLLDILKYIDTVCKKNGIKYFLFYGSCLGAIRHKGFIPWDDDIDIAMLREDYIKFIKLFEETECFALQTYKNDPHYICTYAEVRDKKSRVYESVHTGKYKYTGAFIDVFVIDKGFPSIGKFTKYLTYLLDGVDQREPSNLFRDSIFKVCKPIFLGTIAFLQRITRNMKGSLCSLCYGAPFWYAKLSVDDFQDVYYVDFEGYQFPVPIGWDHYLSGIYGDYMSLPDLNKVRGSMHLKEIDLF